MPKKLKKRQKALRRPKCLRQVETLRPELLAACDGSKCIPQATDVFGAFIDRRFREIGADRPSPRTPKTWFETDYLVETADVKTIFSGSRSFTPHQLVEIADIHYNKLSKLGTTLVLLRVKRKRFVACIVKLREGLRVDLCEFSAESVFCVGQRTHVVRALSSSIRSRPRTTRPGIFVSLSFYNFLHSYYTFPISSWTSTAPPISNRNSAR